MQADKVRGHTVASSFGRHQSALIELDYCGVSGIEAKFYTLEATQMAPRQPAAMTALNNA